MRNCTDAVCAEDTIASLADDVYNSLEGNEDYAEMRMGQLEDTTN